MEHFKNGLRRIGPQPIELAGRAAPMKLLDVRGDRRADAGDLLQPALRYHLREWNGQRQQALRRAHVGARFVRALSGQREPLADLDQALGNFCRLGTQEGSLSARGPQ
jgi:hypothetical protein